MKWVSEEIINDSIKKGEFDAIGHKISDETFIDEGIKLSPPLLRNYSVNLYKKKGNPVEKQTNLSVAIIKGNLAHQKAILKGRSLYKKPTQVESYQQQIESLNSDKANLIMLTQLEYELHLSPIQAYQLELYKENVYQTDISHYIHKKHKMLANKVQAQLNLLASKEMLDYNQFIRKILKVGK